MSPTRFFSGFCFFTPHPPRFLKPSMMIHWWSMPSVSWLYLARRSDRHGAPVLICPVPGRNSVGEKEKTKRTWHISWWKIHLTVVGAIVVVGSEPTGNQGMEKSFESSSLWRDDWDHRGCWQILWFTFQADGNMAGKHSDLFQSNGGPKCRKKQVLRLHQNSHCSLVRRDPELLAFIITARCTTTYNTNIYVYTSWDACNAWI